MFEQLLTLGFHYHVPAELRNGIIHTPGYQGVFLDSLAKQAKEVFCFLHEPSAREKPLMDYTIQASNIHLINLGQKRNVPIRTILATHYVQPIRNWQKKLDVLLVRGPSPLLPAAAKAMGKKPVALLLVGNLLASIDYLPQPFWRKKFIQLWSFWNDKQQLSVAKHSITFVNSEKLYQDLKTTVPSLYQTRTTTLRQTDFYERKDTCQSRPIRLLYTGRLSITKGLFDIIRALAQLVSHGEDLVLDLAGWPEPGEENIVGQLNRLADQLGVSGRIHYLGYKALGPDLFACYRQADIYVIASTSNFEGFPRTIWEAMAHGLPIVASRVGSIPAYIDGTAELFTPCQPNEMSSAMEKLIHQPGLRQERIRQGLKLAHQNTLEAQTEKMMQSITEKVIKHV